MMFTVKTTVVARWFIGSKCMKSRLSNTSFDICNCVFLSYKKVGDFWLTNSVETNESNAII